MAPRSSHGDKSSSSSGILEGSVHHRNFPNGAMGVSPSLGGPGGGGRIGRGRTRSGAGGDAVTDPLIGGVYAGDGGAKCGLGDAEDDRCGSVGGSITLGRCGRAVDGVRGGDRANTGVVCGGDHAGGGDLGRCGGAAEGRGSWKRPEVATDGGGCDFGIFGRGRDLPKELEVGGGDGGSDDGGVEQEVGEVLGKDDDDADEEDEDEDSKDASEGLMRRGFWRRGASKSSRSGEAGFGME